MSGHTPGPWVASGEDRVISEVLMFCGDVSPVTVTGGYRGDIASIQSCNHIGSHGISRKEAAANTRLIAAAPDLLEALRHALPRLAHKASCHSVRPAAEWAEHGSASFEQCDCEIKAARAAIAKATGGAP